MKADRASTIMQFVEGEEEAVEMLPVAAAAALLNLRDRLDPRGRIGRVVAAVAWRRGARAEHASTRAFLRDPRPSTEARCDGACGSASLRVGLSDANLRWSFHCEKLELVERRSSGHGYR